MFGTVSPEWIEFSNYFSNVQNKRIAWLPINAFLRVCSNMWHEKLLRIWSCSRHAMASTILQTIIHWKIKWWLKRPEGRRNKVSFDIISSTWKSFATLKSTTKPLLTQLYHSFKIESILNSVVYYQIKYCLYSSLCKVWIMLLDIRGNIFQVFFPSQEVRQQQLFWLPQSK